MRRAFFGGTFDPPHLGHELIGRKVLETGLADEVILAPSFRPPHKSGAVTAPYHDRAEMTKLAAEGCPGLVFSGIEAERGGEGPSYTIDTLRALSAKYPDDEIILLAGSDSLAQLHTWRDADKIVSGWRMLFWPRKGHVPSLAGLKKHWPAADARRLAASIISGPELEESSTSVRERILASGEVPPDVNPAVAGYIIKNGLYGVKRQQKNHPQENMMEKTDTGTETFEEGRLSPGEIAALCAEAANDRKAEDIVRLEVTDLTSVADYFLVCGCTSAPHLKSVAEHIARHLRDKTGLRPRKTAGAPESGWIVIDFNSVVVHVMSGDKRGLYKIEELWADAPREDLGGEKKSSGKSKRNERGGFDRDDE